MALEPGERLAALTRAAVPGIEVIPTRLEDAHLPEEAFDSVVAATSLHWVNLSVGLPKLHATLRPRGWLAAWRTVFGDPRVRTPYRDRVAAIVAHRDPGELRSSREPRPTIGELVAGSRFEPVRTETWAWTIDLSTDRVRRLFTTFSSWTATEVEAAAQAADDVGGRVTEHYRSVLHLLRSTRPD